MEIPTLLRKAEHAALANLHLKGTVLDLGGDARSAYRTILLGTPEFTTVNLDQRACPDIVHDLEVPLPISDSAFDGVLAINVLEHVYNYRRVLEESWRVLKDGGVCVTVTPFLFPVHPSPNDYWRFTDMALARVLRDIGFSDVQVLPLGTGVLAAQYVAFDRIMPWPLRLLCGVTIAPLITLGDHAVSWAARMLGKKYRASDYALGYMVIARK